MLLSICMMVADPPHRVAAALAPVRHLADEIIIAVDARVPAADLADYQALCDRMLRIEFASYERHLAWLHAQCKGEWIMPLEGDEVPSAAFARRLRRIIDRRDVRQVWASRQWIWPTPDRVLDVQPWVNDQVVKLLRNDGGVRIEGVQHLHAQFERPCEYLEEPIYHLELVTSDLDARRAKVVRYEVASPHQSAPGGGRLNDATYLPEQRPSPKLRAVAAEDVAGIKAALAPARDRPASAPLATLPPLVTRAEMDRLWEGRSVPETAYAARIVPLEEDAPFLPGELRGLRVRVHNDGTERWPWGLEQRPMIRLGHRWLRPDGTLVDDITRRTPFPRAVEPGDDVVVPLEAIAPDEPGEYVLEIDVVHEYVRWFDCTARVRCVVGQPAGLEPSGARLRPSPWRNGGPPRPTRIPRLIHRIWLGGAAMPEEHVRYGETFAEHHPDWEMRLWTDADLPSLGIGERELSLTRWHSETSDLVRYAVLARHGGVYVDTDVECLRPLDPLLRGVDAFAGLETPGRLGTAILGARPGHRLFTRAAAEARQTVGLGLHSVDATGPYFLSLLAEQEPDGLTLFEPELFYPYLWDERERAAGPFPGSSVVHHWATGAVKAHTIPA